MQNFFAVIFPITPKESHLFHIGDFSRGKSMKKVVAFSPQIFIIFAVEL